MTRPVYMLNHFLIGRDETGVLLDERQQPKGIGIFPSHQEAEAAIARVRDKPGFRDWPEGFRITPVVLDRDRGAIDDDTAISCGRICMPAVPLFELYHFAIGLEDDWSWEDSGTWIGLYTSHDRGEAAMERLKRDPEFAPWPEGFRLFEISLGTEEWQSGFASDS